MVALYQARRDQQVEARAERAATEFSAFLEDYIEQRRSKPADDLISHLIAAEEDGERLNHEELIATCVLLLNAGHEATVHAIGNSVAAMLNTRIDLEAAFADPTSLASTVEEALRFDAPLHLFTRFALEDVEVFGRRFRRGEEVGCLLAAANRDPALYPEPDVFKPERNPKQNVSFGAGIHFCLGAPLARLEMACALPALLAQGNLRLAAKPVFADRYHFRGLTALMVTREA